MENRTCRVQWLPPTLDVFGRSPKMAYVTCRDRRDGGGAQVCAQLSGIIYAALCGATYAHTPFQEIAHGPVDQDPAVWVKAWEEFFSIGAGEVQALDLSHLRERELRKPHRKKPKNGRLNVVHHCHKITNHHPDAWNALRPSIRSKYFLHKKPATPLENDTGMSIAVHVRRGDVTQDGSFSERYTSSSTISSHVKRVVELLGRDRCQVHLFSQSGQDLAEFEELDPQWHLDLDPFTTLHSLASADILFAAKSCFSWLAGLITTGHVIQDEFWHPSMPGWINFKDLPKLSDTQLLSHLQSPPTAHDLSIAP